RRAKIRRLFFLTRPCHTSIRNSAVTTRPIVRVQAATDHFHDFGSHGRQNCNDTRNSRISGILKSEKYDPSDGKKPHRSDNQRYRRLAPWRIVSYHNTISRTWRNSSRMVRGMSSPPNDFVLKART